MIFASILLLLPVATAKYLTGVLVADVDGLDTERCRGVGNFLAMLVGASLKEHSLAAHALVP